MDLVDSCHAILLNAKSPAVAGPFTARESACV
jgi:hypothetical protein